ncbi:transporter [Celeribacter ethanolicus]|uniref:Transporter n=1 Tax=Celeribacter ethanolicus TaxID=1758178 RepID=A0A291GH33_9RHOB|nr:EamA family transporter [Celeribacter ethanolicus]ATG49491.1 transporter [Celeribacter ethanolicus]
MTDNWQFWALLSALFAALTAITAKIGVTEINSNFATFLRTGVVFLASGLFAWSLGDIEPLSNLSAKGAGFLAISGLMTGASWLCYFRALQIGKASQVAPVDKLSVVFVAILAALVLGEELSPLGWVGVGLISTGAVVMAIA